MQNDHSDRIRQRAQEIWEQEGRPEGRAEEHWARAERELGPSPKGGQTKAAGKPAGQAKAPSAKKAANGAAAAKSADAGKRRGSASAPQG